MTSEKFQEIIDFIINNCRDLKNKYVDEDLEIDYICIFSKDEGEYGELQEQASALGEIADNTTTGPVFIFDNPPDTAIGKPKVLKIRMPDKTRPERGDVDFNTDYEELKNKYYDDNKFKLIKRERFEMLELRDPEFNVLVYFSSIPPSKLL